MWQEERDIADVTASGAGSVPRQAFWLRRPLHPVLLAPVSALNLWADNIGYVSPRDALPIVVTLALVGGSLTALLSIRVDLRRGALMASSLLAWFGLYGFFVPRRYPATAAALVWTLLLVVLLVGVARLPAAWLGGATAVGNSLAVVLLAFNVAGIATNTPTLTVTPIAADASVASQVAPGDGPRPDVWYLIPDRYGRSDLLADQLDVDNRAFLDALRARGFTIFEDAWASYPNTDMSLASAWSLENLPAAGRRSGDVSDEAEPRLRRPPIADLFREAGYEYVHLGSWTRPTATATNADRVLTLDDSNEFYAAWEGVTFLPALYEVFNGGDLRSATWQRQVDHARHQLATLQELAVEESSTPRFVIAHLLLPHPPHVFREDGTVRPYRRAESADAASEYGAQMDYLNTEVLAWLDVLDEHDPGAVVAIIADEGPYPGARPVGDPRWYPWQDMSTDEERMKMGILAAVRYAGTPPDDPGRTPVNLVRSVVDDALGTDLAPVPDVAYRRIDEYGATLGDITARLGL